jgi:hypothetical protein
VGASGVSADLFYRNVCISWCPFLCFRLIFPAFLARQNFRLVQHRAAAKLFIRGLKLDPAATRQQEDRPTNRTVLNILQFALDCLKPMLKASPPQPIISGRCQERYTACFFVCA